MRQEVIFEFRKCSCKRNITQASPKTHRVLTVISRKSPCTMNSGSISIVLAWKFPSDNPHKKEFMFPLHVGRGDASDNVGLPIPLGKLPPATPTAGFFYLVQTEEDLKGQGSTDIRHSCLKGSTSSQVPIGIRHNMGTGKSKMIQNFSNNVGERKAKTALKSPIGQTNLVLEARASMF